MMKKAKRILSLLCVTLVGGALSQGCFLFKEKDSSNRLGAETSSQISGPGTLSLGETMLNEIVTTLMQQANYSRTQARSLADGALAIMESSDQSSGQGLALAAKVDMNNLLQVAPAISQGMITGMNSKGAALDSDDNKVLAAGFITSALFKTLTGRMENLSAADKIKLPGTIASKAIGSLSDGGVSAKIGGGAGSIMKESVAGLGSMGFASENITAAVKQVTKEGIGAISNNHSSASVVQDAAKNIVQSAIGALTSMKESSANDTPTITEMVGPLVASAVGALKNVTYSVGTGAQISVSTSSQMQSIVGNMMSGAVNGLNTAGVTTAKEMGTALTSATSNAISGLKDAGLSTQQVTYALSDIVKGTVSTLGNSGTNSVETIKAISSNVASTALTTTLGMIDKSTENSAALVKKAAQMTAQGALNGLGVLTQNSTIKAADLKAATQEVTKSTVNDLIVASKTNTAVKVDAALVNSVAEGITEGLYKSGMGSTAITTATAGVGDGAAQGVASAALLGASTTLSAADMKSSMQDSVNTVISEAQTRCEQAAGKWDSATGICQYPTATAPTGSTVSTAQQAKEQTCQTQGGQVLYTAAGSFVCLIADTTPPKDPTNVVFAHRYCTTTNLTMSWMTDTADTSLKTHNVKLCSNQSCNNGCTAVTIADGTSTTMTGSADTTYYGCVQAIDSGNNRSQWVASALPVTIDTSFRFPSASATCDDANMIVSWEPVSGATNYDITLYDRTCSTAIGQSYDGLTGTKVAIAEDLAPNTLYCVKIAAKDDSGDIIASSNVVDNFGDTYSVNITHHDMVFERAYYQTRSIKRLLVDTSVLPAALTSATISISSTNLTCSIARNYMPLATALAGSVDALVFDDQQAIVSLLPYGTSPAAVGLTLSGTGMTKSSATSPVILRDFAIQSLTTTSFGADNVQVKNGYQGWVNSLSGGSPLAGGNILLTGFESIVNY